MPWHGLSSKRVRGELRAELSKSFDNWTAHVHGPGGRLLLVGLAGVVIGSHRWGSVVESEPVNTTTRDFDRTHFPTSRRPKPRNSSPPTRDFCPFHHPFLLPAGSPRVPDAARQNYAHLTPTRPLRPRAPHSRHGPDFQLRAALTTLATPPTPPTTPARPHSILSVITTLVTAMAPSPITPARPARGRPRGRPRGTATGSAARVRKLAPDVAASEPPPKKRRYIPGGPGGGGRFVDEDGNETPAEPSAATASRPRANAHASPSVFPRREPSRRTRTAVNRDELDEGQYSSAAAVAAAVVQSEGYKPREERGWEEFHPNLDIERTFFVFPSEEVDGLLKPSPPTPNPATQGHIQQAQIQPPATPLNGTTTPLKEALLAPDSIRNTTPHGDGNPSLVGSLTDTPSRRRLGRLARDSSSLYATRPVDPAPKVPKVLPIHNQTPKERLDLKLPSYRRTDRVSLFESKTFGQARYVDKSMMNVGYQESDNFIRPDRKLIKAIDANVEEDMDLLAHVLAEGDSVQHTAGAVGRVEYDMDEQDDMWLEKTNEQRKASGLVPITREIFEITITKIEKEWHALEKRIPKPNPKPPQTHRPRSSSAAAVSGEPQAGEEQDSKCAICDDGDCENTNAIVFCDGCDLAVHQECYGVPFIPEGQWLCRKCQLVGRGVPVSITTPVNLSPVLTTFADVHILSQHRGRIQADDHVQMGPSALCHVDSRGHPWELNFYGARHGGRKSPQDEMEVALLHLQSAHGGLRAVF